MTSFFPTHIAVEIFTWAVLTAGIFWLAIARSLDANSGSRRGLAKVALAVTLAVWFAIMILTARSGIFRLDRGTILPNIVLAIIFPAALGTFALLFKGVRTVTDGVPQSWLSGIHGVRIVFGYAFIACYELGELPAPFAFAAGYGDILAGVLGLSAAYLVVRGSRFATPALVVWNVVGIADFLNAVPTGLAVIAPDAPFQGFYPFYLIPGFVVPMLLLFHVYSIKGLVQNALRARCCKKQCAARTSELAENSNDIPSVTPAGA